MLFSIALPIGSTMEKVSTPMYAAKKLPGVPMLFHISNKNSLNG
jgi:hypothetical protein